MKSLIESNSDILTVECEGCLSNISASEGEIQTPNGIFCPNCSSNLLNKYINNCYDHNSDYILIYPKDNDYINKAIKGRISSENPFGPNVVYCPVDKKFWDLLIPSEHKRTNQNDPRGKVLLNSEPKYIQYIIQGLKSMAQSFK